MKFWTDAERASMTAPATESAQRPRSAWLLAAIGAVLIAVTIGAAGLAVWEQYYVRIDREVTDTRNLATILAEQTARTTQAVDGAAGNAGHGALRQCDRPAAIYSAIRHRGGSPLSS